MTSQVEPSTVPPRDRATRKDHALSMLGQTALDGWAVMESQLSAELDSPLRASFRTQAGWDPGRESGYVFLVLRPTRVQAWRERNEIPDRDLMVDGYWLV